EFQQRELHRQKEFESSLHQTVSEFEKLSRELLAKIEDRAVRAKVEREADKRAAELKREAQQAAQAATRSTRAAKVAAASEDLPPQLRGVRVVRDGKVVHGAAPKGLDNAERAGNATVKEGAAVRTQEREIRVGDRVRLSTFGSVGIVDQIKGTEA